MSVANRSATAATILEQRIRWYGRIAAGRTRHAARLALASVGLPVSRYFLELDCPDGDEASGLFSEVAAVIGCAAEVEAHPRLYAGMRVDFQRHGLYYDASVGPNWWAYYFEPLMIGNPDGAVLRPAADWEHDGFAQLVELAMPRTAAAALVKRHARVKSSVMTQVDQYWTAHAGGADVVGVHYRGTDKWEGAPVVPLEAVAQAVLKASRTVSADRWKLLIATDEEPCVDFMRQRFPGRVIALDIPRSSDGRPLHKAPGNGYRKGETAIIDCLLLARCAHLIRTDSDLGLFSTFFNLDLPVTMLSTHT
jgi:hypothetical protein